MPEKILVAMSGGVDSSVAALLLKQQGHQVIGAYMKNWINEDGIVGDCPWQQDIEDARAVAEHIGIEFQVVNLMREYRARVVDYLLEGYASGLTPNPDIMCNREIKFGVFRAWAKDRGFDAVATGHYARIAHCGLRIADCGFDEPAGSSALSFNPPPPPSLEVNPPSRSANPASVNPQSAIRTLQLYESANPQSAIRNPQLFEAADKHKDQSYFLALLSSEQLRDARFPIGHLEKTELRRIAREAQLP